MIISGKLSEIQPIRVLIVETEQPIRSQEISKFRRVINERIGPKKRRLSRKSKVHRPWMQRFSNLD